MDNEYWARVTKGNGYDERKEGSLIYQGDNTKYEGISKTLRHDENYVDESQLLILDVVSSWICSMRRSSTHNLSKPKVQPQ